MGEYVRAAYIAVGMLFPLLIALRRLHPWPPTQDLALGFLLGMSGTFLVLLARRAGGWPEEGVLGAFLTAGGLEEGVKLTLGFLLLRRLAGEACLGPAEGMLTLAFLGAGFEAVEDFQYLVGWVNQGVPLGAVVAARALPMHLALGLVVGGRLAQGSTGNPGWLIWAWTLAAALHGGFNLVAGRGALPAAAGYAGLTLCWGLLGFLRAGRRSPFGLRGALRRLDPWQAGLEAHRWGWENMPLLVGGGKVTAGSLALALGVVILYPLLVLALGLLLQVIG